MIKIGDIIHWPSSGFRGEVVDLNDPRYPIYPIRVRLFDRGEMWWISERFIQRYELEVNPESRLREYAQLFL